MNGNHHDDSGDWIVGRVENPSREEALEAHLMAYALGELDAEEKAAVDAQLAASPAARRMVEEIRALGHQVRIASQATMVVPSTDLRGAVESRLQQAPAPAPAAEIHVLAAPPLPATPTRYNWRAWAVLAAAACVLGAALGLYVGRRDRTPPTESGGLAVTDMPVAERASPAQQPLPRLETADTGGPSLVPATIPREKPRSGSPPVEASRVAVKPPQSDAGVSPEGPRSAAPTGNPPPMADPAAKTPPQLAEKDTSRAPRSLDPKRLIAADQPRQVDQRRTKHMPAANPGFAVYMSTRPLEIVVPRPANKNGPQGIALPGQPKPFGAGMGASGEGDGGPGRAAPDANDASATRPTNVYKHAPPSETHLALPAGMRRDRADPSDVAKRGKEPAKGAKKRKGPAPATAGRDVPEDPQPDIAVENEFLPAAKFPFSAFSLEVDRSNYELVARSLRAGQRPPAHRVQVEDLINSFRYEDPAPRGDVPLSIGVEAADCPWARDHRLVRIAIVAGTAPTASPRPIANDVRVQVEFHPAVAASYRLIGYDGPLVAERKTDDGGLPTGVSFAPGQSVTALYEVVPATPSKPAAVAPHAAKSHRALVRDPIAVDPPREFLTARLLYRRPQAEEYRVIEFPWIDSGQSFDASSRDFRFAAAVAAFGMVLRGSQYGGDITLEAVERIADAARGEDPQRAQLVDLVRMARAVGRAR